MLNLNMESIWDMYEQGCGKSIWKTLIISNDAIHVQAKGGKDNNVKCISTLKVDDCLCGVHDVWRCVKLVLASISDHNHNKEHMDAAYGMDGHLV
jgi:hypothetical protein